MNALARTALAWLAAALTAARLWARTGIGVFLLAAFGMAGMVAVWTIALTTARKAR